MSRALVSLKEYVEKVDNEFLSKEENLKKERERLEEWKNKFRDFVIDIVKTIAEYSLFTPEEEKDDWLNKEQRKEFAEDFIKEHLPLIWDNGIEYLIQDYLKIYLPEKDEIYEEYLEDPLTELYDSFRNHCIEEEAVFLIKDNLANTFAEYKSKLSGTKVLKMISMHYKLYEKFEEWSNLYFSSIDEKKYFLRLQEKNVLDLLKEYKKFVEGTEATEQKFINELVYAQMFLKQKFLIEE